MWGGLVFRDPMRAGRNWSRTLQLALILLLSSVAPALADASLSEEVKAAYLLKLPQFITWPPAAAAAQVPVFNLCIVGETPIGDLLDRAASDVRVNGKPVGIQRLEKADLNAHCQVMYIASDSQVAAQAIAAVTGNPVLTVTDSQKGEASRGVVNFVTVNNKVRFEIDRMAADRNHLQVSSKLLTIAVTVYTSRSGP